VTPDAHSRTVVAMGTFVTIKVVARQAERSRGWEEAVERAFNWFHAIEERCSRFDPSSELMQLTAHAGAAVPVSAIVYEAVRFALAVAEETGGAFDPTVGHQLEERGFNREHRSGATIRTPIPPGPVSYRDVVLDPDRQTITLVRPLILDLGAVAKGLAIDMAVRELQPLEDFAVDAGGDLYMGGRNPGGSPWLVGIRHPRRDRELIDTVRISDKAVCTSGDYERRSSAAGAGDAGNDHHIIAPRTGTPISNVASVTVVAPTAMLADALATAVFVLGPADGLQLLDRLGVDGLIVLPTLERCATRGMCSEYELGSAGKTVDGGPAILQDAEGPAHGCSRDPGRSGVARQGRQPRRA
jgi:thiamine biosynthesis lipoprotein